MYTYFLFELLNIRVACFVVFVQTYVTCSAIQGVLDKDDDLRASHELLNTEIIFKISQTGAEI